MLQIIIRHSFFHFNYLPDLKVIKITNRLPMHKEQAVQVSDTRMVRRSTNTGLKKSLLYFRYMHLYKIFKPLSPFRGQGLYLTKAVAKPPSTFSTFPVDLFNKPPTKARQALAISSGKIISFNKVRPA